MGGLFVFKRFYTKQNPNISMHFQNTRSAMDAARVKICKFNEIRFNRNKSTSNSKYGNSGGMPHTTMIDEQEAADLTSQHLSDENRNLLH